MTHMMEREWARQKAGAGVRSLSPRVSTCTHPPMLRDQASTEAMTIVVRVTRALLDI
jgi:hypothetical protein